MKKIVFAGLGKMGLPMSINLAKRYQVYGFDMNKEVLSQANKFGIQTVSSDVASEADVFLTMLPSSKQI